MITLTPATNGFDADITFNVNVGRKSTRKCSLKMFGGRYKIMQHCGVISSSYTPSQIAERARLNASSPLRGGDIVTVDGKQYHVVIRGDYSDAGFLTPIA